MPYGRENMRHCGVGLPRTHKTLIARHSGSGWYAIVTAKIIEVLKELKLFGARLWLCY